jgi:hypothetical protein
VFQGELHCVPCQDSTTHIFIVLGQCGSSHVHPHVYTPSLLHATHTLLHTANSHASRSTASGATMPVRMLQFDIIVPWWSISCPVHQTPAPPFATSPVLPSCHHILTHVLATVTLNATPPGVCIRSCFLSHTSVTHHHLSHANITSMTTICHTALTSTLTSSHALCSRLHSYTNSTTRSRVIH